MARAVWKFPVPLMDRCAVEMPAAAEILHFDVQHEELFLWALIDLATGETEPREFRLVGTGHRLEGDLGKHLGTAKLRGGELIVHLFEAK